MRNQIHKTMVFLIWGFVVFSLNTNWGKIPPLGTILNPFMGIWQNGIIKKEFDKEIKGLTAEVEVLRDDYFIPHIFAKNDYDLYFAQGYLHATDRLFQMDITARAGSGRLSEIIGDKTLELDKFMVLIGMRRAAELAVEGFESDKNTLEAVSAYTAGVNAYIKSLDKRNFPVEYKLLNIKPTPFTSLQIGQFLKIMSFRLAGKNHDLELSRLKNKFGINKTLDLFPNYIKNPSPIVDEFQNPKVRESPKNYITDFESAFTEYNDVLLKLLSSKNEPDGFNGSNNWAVSKFKTQNGYNLLANDTHLALNLPSVWYEMQLSSLYHNTYGASFPGAPGIIIGHNNNISWAVTNATVDVMDFYEVEFRDQFSEYLFNGEWKKSKIIEEEIKIKNQSPIKIKTIWTHQGVVVDQKINKGLVMAWLPHQKSTELQGFLNLNKSKDHKECIESVTLFLTPAQNFICSDRKDISITHNGKVPIRKIGQGRFIMDGNSIEDNWNSYISRDEMPRMMNPKSGVVRSANQSAVDEKYKYYLGWYYDDPFRAARISDVLKKKNNHSMESFKSLQFDNHDLLAEKALPLLLSQLDQEGLNEVQKETLMLLKVWDYRVEFNDIEPSIFYVWWQTLRDFIWSDQLWTKNSSIVPQDNRTLSLIENLSINPNHSDLFWLNDINSDTQESFKKVLNQTFLNMWKKMESKFGRIGENWQWQYVNPVEIPHIAFMPGFEGKSVQMGGSLKTVNANKGNHGASWKMIVELKEDFEMWTNIPGGVSGNPFHPSYQDWVDSWSKGEMKKVFYIKSMDQTQFKNKMKWKPKL